MKLLITLLVTLGISMGSYGAYMTAAQLLERCESVANVDKAVCLGYVQGAVDTFESVMSLGAWPKNFCIPQQVTLVQLSKVLVKYLNEHPEDLHYMADNEVHMAFMKAFPCEK